MAVSSLAIILCSHFCAWTFFLSLFCPPPLHSFSCICRLAQEPPPTLQKSHHTFLFIPQSLTLLVKVSLTASANPGFLLVHSTLFSFALRFCCLKGTMYSHPLNPASSLFLQLTKCIMMRSVGQN